MEKIVCFGELLIRYSPHIEENWISESKMPFFIGGSELNVATALGNWNIPVKYITAIPDHYLSREIVNHLNSKGLDLSQIKFQGNRIGSYYLPIGREIQDLGVIYDRENSSFSNLDHLEWESILKDCSWFHISAISPSLNEKISQICLNGMKLAHQMGIQTSLDLNFRSKLWQKERDPIATMKEFIPYCDTLMGNLWSLESLLGIPSPYKSSRGVSKEELSRAAKNSIEELRNRFSNIQEIALTFRMDEEYWSLISLKGELFQSKVFELKDVVDRVGTGDCFMAGLIFGILQNYSGENLVNFATGAAVIKFKEAGDCTKSSLNKIKLLGLYE